MRFDVVTLFPELFAPFLTAGVTRRAFESKQVDVRLWNLRDFAEGNYRRVDDRPFGGGPGMVMLAEPLARCLAAVRADPSTASTGPGQAGPGQAGPGQAGPGQAGPGQPGSGRPVVLFSPVGQRLDHAAVAGWSASAGAILLCGRYEGIDQRFIDAHVDVQLSLGDFVLSGGEIPAMALLDAVARLQPGVLNDAGSHQEDSFNPALDGLLDCPHFTRPEEWEGRKVPEELLSGHHVRIESWRRRQRLALTASQRPELIAAARAAGRLSAEDEVFLSRL